MIFMGAPLLAYVQNIVQEMGVRVSSRMVMCGGNAAARGQVLRNCWHGTAGSSPVEWCNRFVSFGLGYALSGSGVSSCPVGWGVSRDLVRMSRLR